MIRLALVFLLLLSCADLEQALLQATPKRKIASNPTDEKVIEHCGQHPYQQDNPIEGQQAVQFQNVVVRKHGFILQNVYTEGEGDDKNYYVNATHFSTGNPHHMFSVMLKIKLDKSEYEAIKEAFNEHPGKSPEGKFSPFLVLSRQPMVAGQPSPNDIYGFCMKDLLQIFNGQRQVIYGGPKNVMYGNIRKWNPEIREVFAPYELSGGHSPVIEIELGGGSSSIGNKTFGDVTVIFYDAHRPAVDEFANPVDADRYWLRTEAAANISN